MDAFSAQVHDFITQHRLLPPGGRVVAAVSGGADSMALLDCLSSLGHSLTVAHLDHGLRPGSWEEALQVLRLAADRGLPAIAERCDVRTWAEPGENLEAAARRLRYTFLARVAAQTGSGAVATGHTADDQVETFLLHLLRGSGTQGLRGMLPEQPLSGVVQAPAAVGIRLVRPLLCVWHSETIEHCRRLGTPVIADPSNLDQALLRNRVRHELIPLLERYNPQARKAIYRAAQATAEAHAALAEDVGRIWTRVVVQTEGGALVRLGAISALPVAVRKLVLGRALAGCGGESDRAGAVDRLFGLCQRASPGHAELGAGVEAWRVGGSLFLVREARGAWMGFPQYVRHGRSSIAAGHRIRLGNGWSVSCELVGVPPGFASRLREDVGPEFAWLPAQSLEAPVTVRAWQPGDRMRLFGSGGTAKVVDLLARAEVPPPARHAWPVVLLGNDVAWIPGVQRGELCRVRSTARNLLQLSLIEPRGKPSWLDGGAGRAR